jgi:hypothetical protein
VASYAKFSDGVAVFGGIAVLLLYFIFGKLLVQFYGKQEKTSTK